MCVFPDPPTPKSKALPSRNDTSPSIMAASTHCQVFKLTVRMELLDENLTKMLEHSQKSLAYCVQVDICQDIALAVAYLHSNDIIETSPATMC